ncbi:MAG TPA: hypothetical protein VEW46_22780 [Pyrinomonadaceae bacterium]|nr:hypothetical protein [Pyrinomonadaceae bacterium]
MASILAGAQVSHTDSRPLPKEVQGYKVHRAKVEPKESAPSDTKQPSRSPSNEEDEYDEQEPILIRLGEPTLVKVSPLGVTFDIPVILAAVKQQGEVDRLVFEDMKVNDIPVNLEDYAYPFKLPNKEPLQLAPPLRIFVSTPQAVLRTIDEIFFSRSVWPVTGRIYVCGRFKKFLIKFRRAVPVEVQTSIKNPSR